MKRILKCVGIFALALCMVLSMLAVMASGVFDRTVLGTATIGQVNTVLPYEISFDEEENIITVSAPVQLGGMAFAGWSEALRLRLVSRSAIIDAALTPSGNIATLALIDAGQQRLAGSAFRSMGGDYFMELVGGACYATYCNVTIDGAPQAAVLHGTQLTLPQAPASDGANLFVGWTDGSSVYAAGSELTVSKDLTLTASYLPKIYGQWIVLFADQEGHIVKTVRTEADGKINPENIPEFWETDCFTYNSWDTDLKGAFTADTLVTAQGTRKTYLVDIADAANVVVENSASVGSYVNFSVTVDEGSTLLAVSVTGDNQYLPVTSLGGIRYSFRMPAGNVQIRIFTRSAEELKVQSLYSAEFPSELPENEMVDAFLVPPAMQLSNREGLKEDKEHK